MNPFKKLKIAPYSTYRTSLSATKSAILGHYSDPPEGIYNEFCRVIAEQGYNVDYYVCGKLVETITELWEKLEGLDVDHAFMSPETFFLVHKSLNTWELFKMVYLYFQQVTRFELKVKYPVGLIKYTDRLEIVEQCCVGWEKPVSEYSFYSALILNKNTVRHWICRKETKRNMSNIQGEIALREAGVETCQL